MLLRAVAVCCLVSGPALAADLPAPRPMPYKAPPAAVAYSWTGFYIGGNVGAAWENTDPTYSYTSIAAPAPPGFNDVFGPGGPLNVGGTSAVASAIADGFLPTSLGSNNTSVLTAGVQIGYNYQVNQTVWGVETDFNWLAGGVKTTGFTAPANGIITNVDTSTAGLRWLGTLRGRVGWAFDRALVYATGGLAYGDVVASATAMNFDGTNTDLFAGGGSNVRYGYVVGGGLEYAVTNNISLRGEYLYYNLGTVSYSVAPINTFAAGEGLTTTGSLKVDGSIARFGINYKFGG